MKYILNEASYQLSDFILNYLGYHILKPIVKSGSFKYCYELNNNKVIAFIPYSKTEVDSEIYNSLRQRDLKLHNLVKIYEVGKI